ncbi:MAG: SIS domain-containing protein [Thermodesulfobacteriota bacterium]
MSGSLSEYVHHLCRLMLGAGVTVRHGKAISLDAGAALVVEMVRAVKASRGKVLVVGNGGSAAMASHFQNDLAKAVGLRAMVFDSSSLLTAIANDDGYERVFERPIAQWAEDGDLLFAISSSGASPNILRAVRVARQRGCKIVSLSGFEPANPLRELGDVNFYVERDEYGLVETSHAVILHYLTDRVMALEQKDAISDGASLSGWMAAELPLT